MPTKKLLLDARMVHSSGIGTYLKSIIPALQDQFDLVLIGDREELLPFSPADKIIPFTQPVYSVKEQSIAFKVSRCDLFWSPHYNVPLLPLKAGKRVVTIHDVFHLAFFEQLSPAQKAYSKLMLAAAVKLSDAIVTVSDFSRKEIIKYTGCPADKIHVIWNGVRTDRTVKDEQAIKRTYNLPDKYILFVGNVKPHKNLRKLLEAYLLSGPEILAEYKIVIVGKKDGFITGDAELLNWVASTPELSENIRFTGYVADEDMDSIYTYASLFVFPSLYEGFGLPPLEAMLNGCPVITSDAASLPEVCGDAALYFDPSDAIDIGLKIRMVLKDQRVRDSLITQAPAHLSKFSWQQSAMRHVELFNMLLN